MTKFLVTIAVLAFAAGCAIKPNYFYEAGQSDPELVFSSDFYFDTFFSVNIDPSSDNSCQKFMLAAYIENEITLPSVLSDPSRSKAPGKEFSIRVPPDQVVAVKAFHSFSGGRFSGSCGPLYASFTPKKGETYKVRMNKTKEFCGLSIDQAGDSPTPVKASSFKTCN